MPSFIFKIKDTNLSLLKKLDAVQVWGEDIEDSDNDIEAPEDILKAEKPKLIEHLKHEIKSKGMDDSDLEDIEMSFSLCIGITDKKVEDFISSNNPDGLYTHAHKLGLVEVNGIKSKYFLYYVASA